MIIYGIYKDDPVSMLQIISAQLARALGLSVDQDSFTLARNYTNEDV